MCYQLLYKYMSEASEKYITNLDKNIREKVGLNSNEAPQKTGFVSGYVKDGMVHIKVPEDKTLPKNHSKSGK